LLLDDQGRYELYQYANNRETLISDYDTAQRIIAEITDDIAAQPNITGSSIGCEIIHTAYQNAQNGITRYSKGCKAKSYDSADEELEMQQETLAFWQRVGAEMSPESYGPMEQNITYSSPADTSSINPAGDIIADYAKLGFGGWLLLGVAGAGISGLRRRANNKNNGPL
jgi:hypothetical protein